MKILRTEKKDYGGQTVFLEDGSSFYFRHEEPTVDRIALLVNQRADAKVREDRRANVERVVEEEIERRRALIDLDKDTPEQALAKMFPQKSVRR